MWIAPELYAQRGQWPQHIRCPRWQPSQWLPGGLWVSGLMMPSLLNSGVSLCDPWGAHRRPLHPVRPSCKFSHCFEPKMGILVLCRRCVPSLSRRPQSLENRCHLPECWHASRRVPSISLPSFGQCYNEHLAFWFWLVVEQTDVTESALDTAALRQC